MRAVHPACHLLVITAAAAWPIWPAAPRRRRRAIPTRSPTSSETNDPLEPTNRVFYAINNGLDTVILRPAAQAYRFVRAGAGAQRHPQCADQSRHARCNSATTCWRASRAAPAIPTMRFLINTTVGVLGVFDVAKGLGLSGP